MVSSPFPGPSALPRTVAYYRIPAPATGTV